MISHPTVAHYPEALAKCMTQWVSAQNFQAMLRIFCEGSQRVEDASIAVFNYDNLASAQGDQLDRFGDLLDQARSGLDDDSYRALLWIQVAKNSCEGTPNEMESLFSRLMTGAPVQLFEAFPASFHLQVFQGTPIILLSFVKEALLAAKPAGVALDASTAPEEPFGFLTDLDALGFGDTTDPLAGGTFAQLF
jgi:hypothetical protein